MKRTLRLALLAPLLLASLFAQPALAAPGFHAAWVDQSPWPTLRPGGTVSYTLHFRNTGTETWQRGVGGRQVNLGVAGDSTAAADAGMAVGWLSANRVATTTEATVAPRDHERKRGLFLLFDVASHLHPLDEHVAHHLGALLACGIRAGSGLRGDVVVLRSGPVRQADDLA